MSKRARQLPDAGHSFIDLQRLWKQGNYTLEECLTQLLHAIVRFEARKNQLDFKLRQFSAPEDVVNAMDAFEVQQIKTESEQYLTAISEDKRKLYEAMNFILEQLAVLEMRFIQLEREFDALATQLDNKRSYLN